MRVLVINGPNLNLLGERQPGVYGNMNYEGLCEYMRAEANKLNIETNIFQSNIEGEIVTEIQNARLKYDAVIINPGAYTHYSYAIYDAILAVNIPVVEVHISNIYKREEFRHHSVIAPGCVGQISGLGCYGYIAALNYLKDKGE